MSGIRRGAASLVYLLHFDVPFKHARHYMGSTGDLEARRSLRCRNFRSGSTLCFTVCHGPIVPCAWGPGPLGGQRIFVAHSRTFLIRSFSCPAVASALGGPPHTRRSSLWMTPCGWPVR